MAVTFDHQTWGDLGIVNRYRYTGASADPTQATNNHTYWKDQALKKWLGDVNNVALDISSLTGTTSLADGTFTIELQRADRTADGFNACKGLEITFDVYNAVIDPATLVISNKGYGGWMAGDVADITGDWQITVLSADASIGLLNGFDAATVLSSGTYNIGWMFGVDREVGSAGYTCGIWFYYAGISALQAKVQVFYNWQDLVGSSEADNGYGTRTAAKYSKYAVYDQSDYQVADTANTLNFTYCSDPGNSFFSFSADNPNSIRDQENFGWGFVRLNRPAGSTYITDSSEWVFMYHLPDTLSDADAAYLYSDMRVMTVGNRVGTVAAGSMDTELPYSSASGYLMRNQPILCRGGLSGYLPSGLGWNSSYNVLDEMVDGDGYTWIKCHNRQWVKVQ